MASINIGSFSNSSTVNSSADKVNLEGAILVVNGSIVSANNPLPVSGSSGSFSNNTVFLTQGGNTMYTNSQIAMSNTANTIAVSNSSFIHREVQNTTNTTLYIGNSTVTVNTGYPISAGGVYDFSRFPGTLYGVINSNTSSNVATLQY